MLIIGFVCKGRDIIINHQIISGKKLYDKGKMAIFAC
jgi:hypothetical protein